MRPACLYLQPVLAVLRLECAKETGKNLNTNRFQVYSYGNKMPSICTEYRTHCKSYTVEVVATQRSSALKSCAMVFCKIPQLNMMSCAA